MPGHGDLVVYSNERTKVHHPDEGTLDFSCGYCGADAHGIVVARYRIISSDQKPFEPVRWLMCPRCGNPTVISKFGNQYPVGTIGPDIAGLPEVVFDAYTEAREAAGVRAFTASALICRKILMYVAVEEADAPEGKTFAEYIDSLGSAGYVTPVMKPWVEAIRRTGNSAAHELDPIEERQALSTLTFTAQLLRVVYEMAYLGSQLNPADEE